MRSCRRCPLVSLIWGTRPTRPTACAHLELVQAKASARGPRAPDHGVLAQGAVTAARRVAQHTVKLQIRVLAGCLPGPAGAAGITTNPIRLRGRPSQPQEPRWADGSAGTARRPRWSRGTRGSVATTETAQERTVSSEHWLMWWWRWWRHLQALRLVCEEVRALGVTVVGHHQTRCTRAGQKRLLGKEGRSGGAALTGHRVPAGVQQLDELRCLGPGRGAHVEHLGRGVCGWFMFPAALAAMALVPTLWCGWTSMSRGGIMLTASWRLMLPCGRAAQTPWVSGRADATNGRRQAQPARFPSRGRCADAGTRPPCG